MGRKALFMGVPEKELPEDDSQTRARLEEIRALIERAREGDFSGRMRRGGADKGWEDLAESVNSLFSRIEEFGTRSTLYKKIFEQQTTPFILKDPGGETILSNPSYEALEEAAATTLEKEGIGSESMASFVSKEGNSHTREIIIPLKDGTERVIEERSTPLQDEKGVFAVLFTLSDVTAYKKAKREMALYPEEGGDVTPVTYQPLFQDNPLPGLVVDSGMNVRAFNEAFLSMTGIAPDDLAGMNYHSLAVAESEGQDLSYILEKNKAGCAEITFNFPSGPRVVRQYGIPIPVNEGDVEIALLFVDMTAEREETNILESQVQELRYTLQLMGEESRKEEAPELTAVSESLQDMIGSPGEKEGPSVSEPVQDMIVSPEKTQKAHEEEESIPVAPVGTAESDIAVVSDASSSAGMQETPDIVESGQAIETPARESKKESMAPVEIHDVVEFSLGKEYYALDIGFAREIVEMMPITPIPRAPHYLRGIINLRGEITNIIDINRILGVSDSDAIKGKKIIVLSSEACGGENIGIIVDDVQSVVQIHDEDIEQLGGGISDISDYIKGIIQISGRGVGERRDEKSLMIWIDIQKVLSDLISEYNL
jgi:purine-binding chemotaxis protein CheW